MKHFLTLILTATLLIGANSCLLVVDDTKHDNGKHRGWYKNPHNPHNPAHVESNPGNVHGNGKKR